MKKIIFKIIMCGLALVFLYPFMFMAIGSLMSEAEILSRFSPYLLPTNAFDTVLGHQHFAQFTLFPDLPTASQYLQFFSKPFLLKLFANSAALALPVAVGTCLIAAPAAYAFEQSRHRHKERLFFAYVVVMLLPLQVTLVPNFLMARWLEINGSYWAIILPGIFSPFGVFLIRQQMKGIPRETWEAAQLDGAGHGSYFAHLILPMVKPAIAAAFILTFAEYWNLVDQAIVFIRDIADMPLSVYLSRMIKDDPGMIFSASVLYMIPPLLVFLIGQDYLIQGIRLSGINIKT